jgi:hypothetical protein
MDPETHTSPGRTGIEVEPVSGSSAVDAEAVSAVEGCGVIPDWLVAARDEIGPWTADGDW